MNLSPPKERDKGLLLWYPCLGKEGERMRWQIVYWNQEQVREALKRGRYDDASLTGWGRLDDLIALANGLGVLKELDTIHPELTRESWGMSVAVPCRKGYSGMPACCDCWAVRPERSGRAVIPNATGARTHPVTWTVSAIASNIRPPRHFTTPLPVVGLGGSGGDSSSAGALTSWMPRRLSSTGTMKERGR